ncbi:D-alanyl-D-alanine carboxypeptidase/D-alanyl-D-alanine endopeptidase [Bacillus litorisediminis]|uniref:D-alanyl-D-alanine carboxypeptidase/D-alanyl-D-alanine endopeptidase n=1 Tax=Bacillus litorisediminis TaxID=2922713 RepID=UPI001FAD1D9A|nr:D-alanyl-D-alanine carboxypeptidase/D-alanyl-D-alanine-endopeptidase [Bacillus litorisediminis]
MKGWKSKCGAVLLTFIMLVSLGSPLTAQGESQPAATEEEKLQQLLDAYVAELQNHPHSEGMSVGYEVYSLEDDQVLASYQSDKTFVPASTFKMLVTAVAATKWPVDMTIPTEVYTTGNVSSAGLLNGDIILKGNGDPTLTVEKLRTLAAALREQGIHKVNGSILVDESYFDDQLLGENWMWDDENYDYNMELSALSVNENVIRVNVRPGKEIGEPAVVIIQPAPDYFTVVNTAKTVAGNRASLTIDRTLGKNEIAISGTIGKDYAASGYTATRTVHDPALFAGTVLRDLLVEQGITFKNNASIQKGTLVDGARLAGTVESPKLDVILTTLMKDSNNLYAEMLTKLLGAKEAGEGSIEAGAKVIRDVLVNDLGLKADYLQKDGSGLTRLNHISPQAYIQLLNGMYDSPAGNRFISYLPIAGVDGTLRNRMKGTAAEGNVKAKTGSMSGVNSLAGYVTTKDGKTLAFSIMCNGIYKSAFATTLQNQIAIALAQYPELPNPPVTAPESGTYPLAAEFDPIFDDPAFKGLIKGALIYSTKNKEVLYARQPQSLLTPGASVKLLTAASALDHLGQNYRFKTELYTTGTITDGVLNGDVIVKGYGDPTLASSTKQQFLNGPTLEGMAQDLKKLGIHLVKGNIIVDRSFFTNDVYPPGWTWDNESDPVQAQITALAVDRGTVRVHFEPGKIGKNVEVTVEPNVEGLDMINTAVTGEAQAENTLKIERVRSENTINVSGVLPAGTEKSYTDVTVEAPHVHAGYVLKQQLQAAGVNVHPLSKVVADAKPADANLVKTYESATLSEIVKFMNHHNDNFTAEMITRTLGTLNGGKGTFTGGINTVHSMMKKVIATEFDMMDGSGWTTYTQISAEQFASLLAAQTEKPTFQVFYDALPTIDGTRLVGIQEHREDMRSISGYIQTQNSDLLAYSLLLNGYSPTPSKRFIENFVEKLAVQ